MLRLFTKQLKPATRESVSTRMVSSPRPVWVGFGKPCATPAAKARAFCARVQRPLSVADDEKRCNNMYGREVIAPALTRAKTHHPLADLAIG